RVFGGAGAGAGGSVAGGGAGAGVGGGDVPAGGGGAAGVCGAGDRDDGAAGDAVQVFRFVPAVDLLLPVGGRGAAAADGELRVFVPGGGGDRAVDFRPVGAGVGRRAPGAGVPGGGGAV